MHRPQDQLWSGSLAIVVLTSLFCFTGYHALLIVVPYSVGTQGGSSSAVGATTGGFMLAATVSPLLLRRLMDRPGALRPALLAAVAGLGVSTLAVAAPIGTTGLIAANGLRGLSFGAMAAVSATLAPRIAPPNRRGAAIGVWGMASTIPAAFGAPLGLQLAGRYGLGVVAAGAGALTLSIIPLLLLLREAAPVTSPRLVENLPQLGPLARYAGPLGFFLVGTMSYGTIVTFGPLMLEGRAPGLPVVFVLAVGSLIPPSRWLGGMLADRGTQLGLVLASGAATAAAGILVLTMASVWTVALISGMLFGLGFGVLTTASQAMLMARAGVSAHGTANALFSSTFNAGIGLGGMGFGLLASLAGLKFLFVAFAVILAMAGLSAARLGDPPVPAPEGDQGASQVGGAHPRPRSRRR